MSESKIILEQELAIGRLLAITEELDYVHIVIEPGGQIPSHTLELPAEFFVVSGSGQVETSKQKYQVQKGDLIKVGGNVPRGWTNLSSEPLEILAIKHKGQKL